MQKEKYEIIEEIKSDISQNLKTIFKTYKVSVKDKKIFVTGILVISIDSKTIERYLIEIEMPDFENKYYPIVKEIGGKVPRFAHRHVNTNGTSCLFYPDEFEKHYKQESKLSEFIKGPVFTYFVAQAYYDIEDRWIFEEWEHNDFGAYEYYTKKFDVKDFQTIINFLKFSLEDKHIKKGEVCICGSGKKFRNCHYNDLLEIRNNVPRSMLRLSLKRVERFYEGIKKKVESEKLIEQVIASSYDNKKFNFKHQWYNKDRFTSIQNYLTIKFPPKISKS